MSLLSVVWEILQNGKSGDSQAGAPVAACLLPPQQQLPGIELLERHVRQLDWKYWMSIGDACDEGKDWRGVAMGETWG